MIREQRSNYKGVWNDLSTTCRMATTHVIGDVDEATIQVSAEFTVDLLDRTVQIRPEDTFLESRKVKGENAYSIPARCR